MTNLHKRLPLAVAGFPEGEEGLHTQAFRAVAGALQGENN